MITGLGIGLLGFGLVVVYAGVTGQKLRDELLAVFSGRAAPPGRNQQAAGALAAGQLVPAPVVPTGSNPLPGGIRPGLDTGNILR